MGLITFIFGVMSPFFSEQFVTMSNCCPCARPDPTDQSGVPSFVGEDFYCDGGFSGSNEYRIVWEDPSWDGRGCLASGNQCCNCLWMVPS